MNSQAALPGCLAIPWVGVSRSALAVCALLYALRMFAITAFYHRYFAHQAFRTGRVAQFVFAVVDRLKQRDDPHFDYQAELDTLLVLWREEIPCHGERGYHGARP